MPCCLRTGGMNPDAVPRKLNVLRLLLVEPDDDAARILELGIRKTALNVEVLRDADVPEPNRDYRSVDAVLLNHNLHNDTFSKAYLLKQLNAELKIIVLTSPGEALRNFQKMRQLTDVIHDIFDKPLYFPRLERVLEAIAVQKADTPAKLQASSLNRYLPAGLSLDELEGAHNGDAIRTEKTVLFVDIRRSTEILRKHSLDEFFSKLNRFLARLAVIVERNRGEVLKYTGDGMLAVFGGFARRYLGFRCACELLTESADDADFSIGLGLTDGLVMLGFIGTERRLFYDIIGSNVNIAARFCAEAGAGEMLLSEEVSRASGVAGEHFAKRQLTVKGLDVPVTCYCHQPRSPSA